LERVDGRRLGLEEEDLAHEREALEGPTTSSPHSNDLQEVPKHHPLEGWSHIRVSLCAFLKFKFE